MRKTMFRPESVDERVRKAIVMKNCSNNVMDNIVVENSDVGFEVVNNKNLFVNRYFANGSRVPLRIEDSENVRFQQILARRRARYR